MRGGGDIVEVQGGHIMRSIGRKDRHSKVCTAKGPRDRRVRLSANTAIQFYDVQDRLGYDRPSKAVDWLMKNAKAAIDELAELPAWHPTTTIASNPEGDHPIGDSGKRPMALAEPAFGFDGGGNSSNTFLPPSMGSDSIADTIKSFFPMAAAAITTPTSRPPTGFQNYPPDLLSRTSSQDLRLSLQSFQDPIFSHPTHHQHQNPIAPVEHALFSISAPLAFDPASSGWPEQGQRMESWNVAETGGGGGGGYVFNVASPLAVPAHSMLGQGQIFIQRGPLQSSSLHSVRAWADPMASSAMHPAFHPSVSSIGFASGGSFAGFHIPARIQGEEEHDGIPDKPSSASSAPHH